MFLTSVILDTIRRHAHYAKLFFSFQQYTKLKNVTSEAEKLNFEDSFNINFELFSKNGVPLKFALIGYNQINLDRIRKLIEAYGGMVIEIDGPEAILLSDASSPSSASYECYDTTFLADSIAAQQLQHLKKYRIPPRRQEGLSPVHKRPRTAKPITKRCLEVASGEEQYEPENSFPLQSNDYSGSVVEEDSPSGDEFFDAFETLEEIANLEENKKCQISSRSVSRSRSRQSWKKHIPWSETELQMMIDYLIANKVIHRALTRKLWGECLRGNPLLQRNRRTDSSLYMKFQTYLRQNYADYTKDSDALVRFKALEAKRLPYRHVKGKLKFAKLSSSV